MPIIGALILIAVFGGLITYARHVHGNLKAAGAFQGTPKGVKGTKQRAKITAKRAAQRKPAKVKAGNTAAHPTVWQIIAGGVVGNWTARRAHIRANGKPPRRSLMERLVVPRGPQGQAPAAPAPPDGSSPQPTPQQPHDPDTLPPLDRPQPQPAPQPAPSPNGGTPMTTPNGNGGSGGSAAGDFFSALARLLGEARAGGIRHKVHAHHVMGEGFTQQAAGLEQYARSLQEQGQYPPFAYEPVMQAAGMLRAAAVKMQESSNAVSTIARTPAGELVGMAPHREELNTA